MWQPSAVALEARFSIAAEENVPIANGKQQKQKGGKGKKAGVFDSHFFLLKRQQSGNFVHVANALLNSSGRDHPWDT